MLTLFYITNEPEIALIAERYGVKRIWIDLETIGKDERQRGLNSVISHHSIEDIQKIKPLLTSSEILVRVNSWREGSRTEIDRVISAGADVVMLPYWKSLEEVDAFLTAIDKRCRTSLLLETKEAVGLLDEVLKRDFDEIHIGLNDLSISFGKRFMFELLADGTIEALCKKLCGSGKPYGFGGIAKLGEGMLKAEKIIMEHYRLGSTRAILSRTFCDTNVIKDVKEIERIFKVNMKALREYERVCEKATKEEVEENRKTIVHDVNEIVTKMNQ